ncbi:LppU/SCO3897 family protein [Amycolatopsis pittospori]|uniref:LppU/SCO3897 family protein n=1 Tax=Amycolatopsis pittospori TaxID=2749434 RepID=UPI0015F07167|nr:hypothetical protein [Amycolatopsis pittospori]
MADGQDDAGAKKALLWISILTGAISLLAFLGVKSWADLEDRIDGGPGGATATSTTSPRQDYTVEQSTPSPRAAPTVDPTHEAFKKVSPGDCLNAFADPYQILEWSQDVPSVVDCDRTDAYMRVTRVASSAETCRSNALNAETWWSHISGGEAIYLCLERQLRVGECVLGKADNGGISITGHGMTTSWGCGKGVVPKIFTYILQITALTNGACPTGSYSWDFRGGKLCARVA